MKNVLVLISDPARPVPFVPYIANTMTVEHMLDDQRFAAARPDAFFLHCLPAHPGEEVSPEVLASPRSLIFDEAENRLHMQKAILTRLAGRR